MKKIKTTLSIIGILFALSILPLLLIASVPSAPGVTGVPADSTVSQLSAATTAAGTDVYYIVSGGTSKKITHAVLMSIIRDSLEARNWVTTGDWSWLGGTFLPASSGLVTFGDSVNITGGLYMNGTFNKSKWIYPFSNNSYGLGSTSTRYSQMAAKYMYADFFIVTNPVSPLTDSIIISYDGTTLSMGGLNVSDDAVSVDSSTTFDLLAFTPHSYTIPAVGDTILTLLSANKYSLIELDLPGDITTGISRIYVQGAQKGMILRFYNGDAGGYEMRFRGYVGNDDNIRNLSGSYYMTGQYDGFIEMMCVVESIAGQTWIITNKEN